MYIFERGKSLLAPLILRVKSVGACIYYTNTTTLETCLYQGLRLCIESRFEKRSYHCAYGGGKSVDADAMDGVKPLSEFLAVAELGGIVL